MSDMRIGPDIVVVSKHDTSVMIHYIPVRPDIKHDGSGWHLSKKGVIGSPLELINDQCVRRLVMNEANTLTGFKPVI